MTRRPTAARLLMICIVIVLVGAVSTIRPVRSDAADDRGVVLQAESMAIKTVGGRDGPGWNLWSNGSIGDQFEVETSGPYQVTVRALGRSESTIEPRMELRIDDRTVGAKDVAIGAGYRSYEFVVELTEGPQRLEVAFVNDANSPSNDMDLIVDWVEVAARPETSDDPDKPSTTSPTSPGTIAVTATTSTTTTIGTTLVTLPTTSPTSSASVTLPTTTMAPEPTAPEPTAPPSSSGEGVPPSCGADSGIIHQFRGEDGVENWTGDTNFTTPEQPHTRENITGPNQLVPYGNASMKLEIRPGDPQRTADIGQGEKRRAEFSWSDWRYDSDDEGWVGGAFYLPADPMANNKGTAIFQLHNWPEAGTLWNIHTWDGKLRTNNDPMGRVFETDIGPYLDTWVRVVVNFKSSTGADGFLKMWLNDELVVDRKGPTRAGGTLGPYFKHGTYFWGYGKYDAGRHAVAYFDNLRIADASATYGSVNPDCWE